MTEVSMKDYLEKKLVIRREKDYYLIRDGVEIALGKMPAASKKLKSLELASNSDIPDSPKPEAPLQGKPSKLDEALSQSGSKPSNTPLLEDILGSIRDLKPDYSASQFDIFINGVHYQKRDSKNPKEREIVNSCPVEFYWLEKKRNINNGTTITNGEYTVFNKAWKESLGNISWVQDDTPDQSFVSVGALVLCICKREQFHDKKRKQQLNNMIAPVVLVAKRNEQAKRASEVSKEDLDGSMAIYQQDATATINAAAERDSLSTGRDIKESLKAVKADMDMGTMTTDKMKKLIESGAEIDINDIM